MIKFLQKRFLFLVLPVLFFANAQAQSVEGMSDAQVLEYYQKAQASGMNDSEIEAAAIAKGISLDDINRLKNKATEKIKNQKVDVKLNDDNRKVVDEEELPVKKVEIKKDTSRVFGASIFRNNKISFEPNLKIATPRNYVLGTGDELNIDITGYASAHYAAKVSTEGNIKIENLNPIFVSGLTIEQAKDRIVSRLKTLFAGLESQKGGLAVDVTLGNIRSIKVMIIGEVLQPGTYTLPSLASAFNALYAAGGPTDKGSFRGIEIYRAGKPYRKLDIYDFLLKGDQRNNVILQDQDVIRIPFYKKQVSILGEVKAPLIFELEEGENLGNVIFFAGGYNGDAFTKNVNVERITETEKEIITVFEKQIPTFELKQGDVIKVGKVLDRFKNLVYVEGAINRPGEYALDQAKTVKGLIELADGLKKDAFMNRAIIKRHAADYAPTVVPFDLDKLLSGQIADITLNKTDTLLIKGINQLRENLTITISGEVVNVGKYPYAQNMTISDALLLGGGLKEGASAEYVEIARRIKNPAEAITANASVKIMKMSIDAVLKMGAEDAKYTLEPFDEIFIRTLPNYKVQKLVSITGEVKYPGAYAIRDRSERITELIERAGGVKQDAYLHGSRFTRKKKIVGIDLQEIMSNTDNAANLLLLEGDSLEIPRIKQTVDVFGQVLNPTSVGFAGVPKLKDYIYRSGGFTDSAQVSKVYVKYANGTVAQTKAFMGFRKYPRIEPGAEIYVPLRRKKKAGVSIPEAIAIISGAATVATLLLTVIRFAPTTTTVK